MKSASNTGKAGIYLITAVASLGGLLLAMIPQLYSGAVGSLNNFFISSLSNDVVAATAAITEFKLIITLCTLAVIGLTASFILRFYKRSAAYAIITAIAVLGGLFFYFQFLTLPPVLTENLQNSI